MVTKLSPLNQEKESKKDQPVKLVYIFLLEQEGSLMTIQFIFLVLGSSSFGTKQVDMNISSCLVICCPGRIEIQFNLFSMFKILLI